MTVKPTWYSIERSGSLADFLNLLHPPYTLWHLSYVLMGIAIAPTIFFSRSVALLVAFFLGLGIGAHALDETMGNPLQTRLSKSKLYVIGFSSLSAAVLIGLYYVISLSLLLIPIIAAELFFAIAYNLEIFQKRFHNGLVFALSWGTIPFLTGFFVNSLTLGITPVIMSVGVGLLTIVQRALSTQARNIRRNTAMLEGLSLSNGTVIPLTSSELARPAENALKLLTATVLVFALAFLSARII